MKAIAKLLIAFSLVLSANLISATPAYAHNVEFVILGGGRLRFQHASSQPMAHAKVHVLDEYREIISIWYTDTYGVFDYERYFGMATRLEVRHNNFTVRFTLPTSLPRVVYNDRGELVEIVVPAGSGGRLSLGSLVLIYLGVVTLVGFAVFLVIGKMKGRKPRGITIT